MALDKFIKTVWEARLLSAFQRRMVFAGPSVVNRDYEGEVTPDGTVKILSIGPVTVTDYVKNQDHADPETLSDAERELKITEKKLVNFQIDDLDKAQGNRGQMDEAMSSSAQRLSDVQDRYIAGLYTGASADNAVGSVASPIELTAETVYPMLLQLGTELDEADVPEEDRYAILPARVHELLLGDGRFTNFGTQANAERLANASVGKAAGFNIYRSNNTVKLTGANAGKQIVQAGHPSAITLASGLNLIEPYRPQKRIADAVKILWVYGAKVVRPEGLAVATVTVPNRVG